LPKPKKFKRDKLYQEFTLFVSQPEVKKYIQDLRTRCTIRPKEINRKINKFKAICKKEGKLRKKAHIYKEKKNISFENNPYECKCIRTDKKIGYERIKKTRRFDWERLNKYRTMNFISVPN
jgi:hypothetical protein